MRSDYLFWKLHAGVSSKAAIDGQDHTGNGGSSFVIGQQVPSVPYIYQGSGGSLYRCITLRCLLMARQDKSAALAAFRIIPAFTGPLKQSMALVPVR